MKRSAELSAASAADGLAVGPGIQRIVNYVIQLIVATKSNAL